MEHVQETLMTMFIFNLQPLDMTVNVDGSGSFDAVLELFGGTCCSCTKVGIDNTGNGGLRLKLFMV